MQQQITKVLIANRGEVVVRIARSLKRLKVRSVGVFTRSEGKGYAARVCDEAIELPGQGVDAYLDIAAIVAAAKQSGSAIHPGWGFLAENPNFAEACQEAGLIWIGPSPSAIRTMGDKGAAKELARELGIPTLASVIESTANDKTFEARITKDLSYPIILKPLAGGGGKGMLVVEAEPKLATSLEQARREAEAAFGDRRLLAERLLQNGRHVEVQIVSDQHGDVVALDERDCTLQRRHQKIFEEAPSPFLSAKLRKRIFDDAVQLAKAVEYQNLGTVEFLLASNGDYFFMEMNTRLQVEHPVTELRTGLDMVKLQVGIADGRKLSSLIKNVRPDGHVIEARVYAEEPEAGFLPATGRVLKMKLPNQTNVRVDHGIDEGTVVSHSFDPLLLKVLVHASDRAAALKALREALSQTVLLGVPTNMNYLQWVLDQHEVQGAKHHTTWIVGHLPSYQSWEQTLDATDAIRIAVHAGLIQKREGMEEDDWLDDPWLAKSAWRLGVST